MYKIVGPLEDQVRLVSVVKLSYCLDVTVEYLHSLHAHSKFLTLPLTL